MIIGVSFRVCDSSVSKDRPESVIVGVSKYRPEFVIVDVS